MVWGQAGSEGAGFPLHSPLPSAIISCVQMVTGSLIWDNQRVGAQLGPGPLCWAMKDQPQLERSHRTALGLWKMGGAWGWLCAWGSARSR